MKRGPVETTGGVEAGGTTSVGDQKQLNKKFKRQENDCITNNTNSQEAGTKGNNTGLKSSTSRFDIGPNGKFADRVILPPPYELTQQQKLALSTPLILTENAPNNDSSTDVVQMAIKDILSGASFAAGGGGVSNLGDKTNNSSSSVDKNARKVYVGNVPRNTQSEDLCNFFNDILSRVLKDVDVRDKNNPIVGANINSERQFGFVECRNPTLATVMINLDAIVYQDVRLRIHRPQSYKPENASTLNFKLNFRGIAGLCPTVAVSCDAGVSQILQTSPYKVFVGALPYDVLEPRLTELLETFGELAALHLVKAPGILHRSKGYAFCVWKDAAKVTDDAIKNLNGLEIQGKKLVVKYSTSASSVQRNTNQTSNNEESNTDSGAPLMAGNNVDVHAALKAAGIDTNRSMNNANSQDKHIADSKAAAQVIKETSTVIMLKNMVQEEDLKDDDEYEDIHDDIRDEAIKFGELKALHMPRSGEYICKVFLEYKSLDSASLAKNALHGRQFGEQIVDASFFDIEAYKNLFKS